MLNIFNDIIGPKCFECLNIWGKDRSNKKKTERWKNKELKEKIKKEQIQKK